MTRPDLHAKFLEILKRETADIANEPELNRGEVAAFRLHMLLAYAAVVIVREQIHERGIHRQQSIAAQGVHFEDDQGRRERKLIHDRAKLHDFRPVDPDVDGAMQGASERCGQEFDEPIVDDIQRRHATADHAVLPGEVEGCDGFRSLRFFGRRLHHAGGDALQQRIDLFLTENLFAHCTTNSVK